MSIFEQEINSKLDTLKPPKAHRKISQFNHAFTVKQNICKRELKINNLHCQNDTLLTKGDLSFTNSFNEFNHREQNQKNGFDIEKFMSKANPRDYSYEIQEEERVFNEKRFVSKSDEHQGKIKAKKLHFKVRSELQKADLISNSEKQNMNQSFKDSGFAKKIPCRIDLSKTECFEVNQNFRNAISPQPFCRKIINVVHRPKVLLAFHNKITLTLNSVDEHEHNNQLPEVKMKFNQTSDSTKESFSPLSPSIIEHNRRHINTSKNILKEAVNSPTRRLPVSPRHNLEGREYANRNNQFRVQPNQSRFEETNDNCTQAHNSAMIKQNKQSLNPLKEKVKDLIRKCDEYLIK